MLYICVLDVRHAAFCNLHLDHKKREDDESLNSTMDSSAASHKVGLTAATGGTAPYSGGTCVFRMLDRPTPERHAWGFTGNTRHFVSSERDVREDRPLSDPTNLTERSKRDRKPFDFFYPALSSWLDQTT